MSVFRRLAAPLHKARLLAGFFLLIALAGCVSLPQTELLKSGAADALPERVELAEVPFFPQDDFQCGPASLAMLLGYRGIAAHPDQLKDQVYLPGREGSLQVEMLASARRNGLIAYRLAPRLPDLLRELVAGNPVIVLINLNGIRLLPRWHYAVLIGYDRVERDLVFRSGTDRHLTMPVWLFEFLWQDSNHWAMVAVRPGTLPASAEEAPFAAALAAFERSSKPITAEYAYRALLDRWPDNLVAMIGLGSALYGQKKIPEAAQAFERATRAHPEAAPAFNNLAHVLAELDRTDEALRAAERAVSLGGPHLEAAKSTLEAIRKKRPN